MKTVEEDLFYIKSRDAKRFLEKSFLFFEEKALTTNSIYDILFSEVRKSLEEKEDGNMTKKEMVKRIEELDCAQFELMMKDMWDAQDYELDRHYTREIQKLKEALEAVEG